MPGPNSAPNGDTGIIIGHPDERFVWCYVCRKNERAREHGVKHRNLKSGKTEFRR